MGKANRGRLRRDPSAQVATVLAFVISSATFLAAQDDETGRCSKVVCKSLVMYTALKGFRVQGSGFRVQRVQRGSAAHKNREAPRRFETRETLIKS